MKANEAPEKIYFDGESKACKLPIFSSQNIEYIRTDAFIERACFWLKNYVNPTAGTYLFDEDIEKFRKAMKGE